jgi:4a-hydroxytetrahydrobiopterin dehydratase
MPPLTETEIQTLLRRVPGWERRGAELRRTWTFPDFGSAIVFVNRVAGLAETANHHPDIEIRYTKVTLALSTHDAGGLTARDFALAESIGA